MCNYHHLHNLCLLLIIQSINNIVIYSDTSKQLFVCRDYSYHLHIPCQEPPWWGQWLVLNITNVSKIIFNSAITVAVMNSTNSYKNIKTAELHMLWSTTFQVSTWATPTLTATWPRTWTSFLVPFGQLLWLVNKLAPCSWLLRGVLEVYSLRLRSPLEMGKMAIHS